ncbi:MAG TPA: EF-hand domain-containing protein [Polyangia bacterium]|nr:EF-hand domain-containing protein [Polyangia bacterium]
MTHGTFTLGLGALGIVARLLLASTHNARAHEDLDAEFQKMDRNGDVKICADEHAEYAKEKFAKMDTNGDGTVTPSEMEAAFERRDNRLIGREDKASANLEMSAADKFKMMDTNNDGVLTADEHAAAARAMFEKMDVDSNGALTKAELKSGHVKLTKMMSRQRP